MQVNDVRFEHHREAIGIGESAPRVSWRVIEAPDGWIASAAELESTDPRTGASESVRIDGSDSVLVDWPFAPLASRDIRNVRVRVHGADGAQSDWSEPVAVEAGLLSPDDWSAELVAPDADQGAGGAAMLLRRGFALPAGITRARLHVSAHGVFVIELNGERVGDERLAPGWTSYAHRLRYRTHDVTSLLVQGDNAILATLCDGWFRGRLGWDGGLRSIYGEKTGLLAQLEVELDDGSTVTLGTDGSWRSAVSPIVSSDIYDGEHRDERLSAAVAGASLAGFDDSGWQGATAKVLDRDTLVSADGPPVRPTQVLAPVSTETLEPTRIRVDLGQNLVGVLRIAVDGPAGSVVTLRHAEVLEHGELGIRPLRQAKATDSLTLAGEPVKWQPEFTFHGFRYAELELSDAAIEVSSIEAVVLHSDMERTGDFEASDPDLSRLFQNVVWGMRGNFVDVPTDCPQRDERLGWTGDIAVFSPAATGIYDCSGILASWLADLSAEQLDDPDGIPPLVVPTIMQTRMANAVWGDAAVAVPWALYERYGDLAVLERAWTSMTTWIDAVRKRTGERLVWDAEFQLGDWLDPTAPPDDAAAAQTSGGLVATAWFAHSTEILSRAAGLLGKPEDSARYAELAERIRVAFRAEYVTATGLISSDAQTAYALAIVFDLYADDETRAHGASRLAQLVQEERYRIGTGFAGTPLISDALTLGGYPQLAYRMLAERECPSFLYPVTMGATTIWERWDSMLPDGSINPGEMTSFNHYALGAVSDWMQRTIGGIASAEPGYRRIRVAPIPGGELSWARTWILTPYGRVSTSWTLEGDEFVLELDVPQGVTADVELPDGTRSEAPSGHHAFRSAHGIVYPPALFREPMTSGPNLVRQRVDA